MTQPTKPDILHRLSGLHFVGPGRRGKNKRIISQDRDNHPNQHHASMINNSQVRSQKSSNKIPRDERRIEEIKQVMPIVRNLHQSFWENTKFTTWQLIRLNKRYQTEVDALWVSIWNLIRKELRRKSSRLLDLKHIPSEIHSIVSEMENAGNTFPPMPPEMIERCMKTFNEKEGSIVFYRLFKSFDLYKDYPVLGNETYQNREERYDDTLRDSETREDYSRRRSFHSAWAAHLYFEFWDKVHNKKIFYVKKGKKIPGEISGISNLYPWRKHPYGRLGGIDPMPWRVRFPSPEFPSGSELYWAHPPGPQRGGKTRRRPYKDWASSLLIFELSQVGMRNSEILSLFPEVFGQSRVKLDKDPAYVRVNTIIKTINKAVIRAYPIAPNWDEGARSVERMLMDL